MPGATFTHGVAGQQRARRTATAGVQPSTSKTRPAAVAAGRVGEDRRRTASRSTSSRRPTCTAPARPSAARLAAATATRTGSRSTPAHGEPGPGEGDQVAADAAAEVDHAADGRGRREPARPGASATAALGGLLEAVGGEVHPGGVGRRTSRRPGARSVDLGHRGRARWRRARRRTRAAGPDGSPARRPPYARGRPSRPSSRLARRRCSSQPERRRGPRASILSARTPPLALGLRRVLAF